MKECPINNWLFNIRLYLSTNFYISLHNPITLKVLMFLYI